MALAQGAHLLIIESPYYADVTQELIAGAIAVIEDNAGSYDRVAVPGALEIPQALAAAIHAGLICSKGEKRYAGVIALGCVIRGETAHYDIVCNNANHWLMESIIQHRVPFGNGILTVDTHAQALARAQGGAGGKGGDAARACLRLIELGAEFGCAGGRAART